MNFPDFSTFFAAVWNGRTPFRWQTRFAADAMKGVWPAWTALPTGTGKTSLVDIAVHTLAAQASLPPGQRTTPVRIIFAVNRRIVVDEAFRRAKHIAERLATCGDDPVLKPVADALRLLAGEGAPPLETYPLRGATYTDGAWARSATQPVVITTTLDQLGSRLLFRGYGCSESARPLHAALLTHDALLLLDEAHTSRAFSSTLSAIARWRTSGGELERIPFRTIQLTATPPSGIPEDETFRLSREEAEDETIRQRLNASKPTTLVEIPGATKAARHKKIADECLKQAKAMRDAGSRRILIVVNRIATAETVAAALRTSNDCPVALLNGSMRPLDKVDIVEKITRTHQLQEPNPAADVPPVIVVATQCVEVGADLDFDALITELAPLDALRQRFGRLNRYGRPIHPPAVILAPQESLAANEKSPDPIYADCLPRVWEWLGKNKDGLDFGISKMAEFLPSGAELDGLYAPQPQAPVLLPAHLDLLCQTSPAPHHEPEVSLYIHGPRREFPTVDVIWRDGLFDGDVIELLRILPPLPTEAASFSLPRIRSWLADARDRNDIQDGDLPFHVDASANPPRADKLPLAWVYRNPDCVFQLRDANLLPGDTLVLPTSGAPDRKPLIPQPSDQCERAHLEAKDKVLLVLSESRLKSFIETLDEDERESLSQILAPLREAEAELKEEDEEKPFCEAEWRAALPALYREFAPKLAPYNGSSKRGVERWSVVPHPHGGAIARGLNRVGHTNWPLAPDEIGSQGNAGAQGLLLEIHQKEVEIRVDDAATRLGLSENLRQALAAAARHHDTGKADPRFQAWLHGCGAWELADKPLIAKSGYPPAMIREYAKRAGIPDGFRHELLSTLIVAQAAFAGIHPERDLLLHLVASHHGRCRAAAPVVRDDEPEIFIADIEEEAITYTGRTAPLAHFGEGVPERFWKLTRRFGWWGLAYLETILRLADQQASASSGPNPS